MSTRSEINARYQNDIAAAEAWKENDPEKYNTMVAAAKDRRAEGLEQLADASDAAAAQSALESAKVKAHAQFPLAPEALISGATPEAILESAKALHDFAETQRKEAGEAARSESRAARSGIYQRGVPQSSQQPGGQADGATQVAQAAVDRINAMKAESGKNGDRRDPAKIMSTEDTLAAMRESGKTDRLVTIMTGSPDGGVGSGNNAQRLSEEDTRG